MFKSKSAAMPRDAATLIANHIRALGPRAEFEFIRDCLLGHDPMAMAESYSAMTREFLFDLFEACDASDKSGLTAPTMN